MCGLAGILSAAVLPDGEQRLARMLSSIRHRGPDHTGTLVHHGKVFLGHNRLSIIDLHSSANQPMRSVCGRYVIVFNGEIYNYRELRQQLAGEYAFRTQSDTEVLLAAFIHWGRGMLDRLIGMFAFAIYDQQAGTLFAVRDRFGVKPFYYAHDGQSFLFASEIKALHAAGLNKEPDQRMWASYLAYGQYQWEDRTFWRDVLQLQAGHVLEVAADLSVKISRWYDFKDAVHRLWGSGEFQQRSEEQHLAHVRQLLEDSVALRFRSDVPVGFNLSGGLDSSLLLGLVKATRGAESTRAFTFYCNDDRYDELPWVETMVRQTATPLEKVLLQAHEVPELFEQVSKVQDEPFGGIPTLAYSKIFQRARETGTIVLLDGQGVDEAWAGYDYYRSGSGEIVQGVSASPLRPEVLDPDFRAQAYSVEYPEPFDTRLLNLQFRDLFHTKIPRALRFNDRVSMMHSTELREPFLDHRLVEYAFCLPPSLKIDAEQGKLGARKLAADLLPADVRLAPKRPLQTPQREWLSGELGDWLGAAVKKMDGVIPVDRANLDAAYRDFLSGKPDNAFFVWQWASAAKLLARA